MTYFWDSPIFYLPVSKLLLIITVIGYGLTDTGKTVLSGILIATLGLAWYSAGGNSPFKSRRRQFSLQKRRQQFLENCHIYPDLPECVDALSKGRFIQKRRKFR